MVSAKALMLLYTSSRFWCRVDRKRPPLHKLLKTLYRARSIDIVAMERVNQARETAPAMTGQHDLGCMITFRFGSASTRTRSNSSLTDTAGWPAVTRARPSSSRASSSKGSSWVVSWELNG